MADTFLIHQSLELGDFLVSQVLAEQDAFNVGDPFLSDTFFGHCWLSRV